MHVFVCWRCPCRIRRFLSQKTICLAQNSRTYPKNWWQGQWILTFRVYLVWTIIVFKYFKISNYFIFPTNALRRTKMYAHENWKFKIIILETKISGITVLRHENVIVFLRHFWHWDVVQMIQSTLRDILKKWPVFGLSTSPPPPPNCVEFWGKNEN